MACIISIKKPDHVVSVPVGFTESCKMGFLV